MISDTMVSVYLDNNATTEPSEFVKRALHEAVDNGWGNPESAHSASIRPRQVVESARSVIAQAINCAEENVVMVGSGSEANSYAVKAAEFRIRNRRRDSIVTSVLEHSSIASGLQYLAEGGCNIRSLPIDSDGVIAIEVLRRAIGNGSRAVFVQWANNETGVIQPIEEISALCHRSDVTLHVDAAQAFGRIPIDFEVTMPTTLTITAHKIHGPKGVGALVAQSPRDLVPVVYGGQQEWGRRGGTHNVIGIAGFGAAVKERFADLPAATAKLVDLRDRFEGLVCQLVPECKIQGSRAKRVPNTSCITFPGANGSRMVAWLDSRGVCCSQTSACRSRRPEPSELLLAMGLSEAEAYATIRFSVSVLNTIEEVEHAANLVAEAFRRCST